MAGNQRPSSRAKEATVNHLKQCARYLSYVMDCYNKGEVVPWHDIVEFKYALSELDSARKAGIWNATMAPTPRFARGKNGKARLTDVPISRPTEAVESLSKNSSDDRSYTQSRTDDIEISETATRRYEEMGGSILPMVPDYQLEDVAKMYSGAMSLYAKEAEAHLKTKEALKKLQGKKEIDYLKLAKIIGSCMLGAASILGLASILDGCEYQKSEHETAETVQQEQQETQTETQKEQEPEQETQKETEQETQKEETTERTPEEEDKSNRFWYNVYKEAADSNLELAENIESFLRKRPYTVDEVDKITEGLKESGNIDKDSNTSYIDALRDARKTIKDLQSQTHKVNSQLKKGEITSEEAREQMLSIDSQSANVLETLEEFMNTIDNVLDPDENVVAEELSEEINDLNNSVGELCEEVNNKVEETLEKTSEEEKQNDSDNKNNSDNNDEKGD